VLLAFLFIFRNDFIHADGTLDAIGADTREHLLPGQWALQEPDFHISWQGLEYVGVLLTGGLAALVSTSLVALGAAVIVGALIVTVQAYHRGALQLQ
jgi:hypothetical protein